VHDQPHRRSLLGTNGDVFGLKIKINMARLCPSARQEFGEQKVNVLPEDHGTVCSRGGQCGVNQGKCAQSALQPIQESSVASPGSVSGVNLKKVSQKAHIPLQSLMSSARRAPSACAPGGRLTRGLADGEGDDVRKEFSPGAIQPPDRCADRPR